MNLHHTTVAFLCFAFFALGALLFGADGCGSAGNERADRQDADLVAERDTARAEATRWKAAAADSAALARAWRDIAQREGEVVSDLLASRDKAREHEESARAERDRLASALTTARDEAARLRDASDRAPESPQDARAALTACWDTLSACERLTAQQDTLIAAKDTTIARGDRAIVALQSQNAALDSTATYYQSAYTGLLSGYAQLDTALSIETERVVLWQGRAHTYRTQRNVAAGIAVLATAAALLK